MDGASPITCAWDLRDALALLLIFMYFLWASMKKSLSPEVIVIGDQEG